MPRAKAAPKPKKLRAELPVEHLTLAEVQAAAAKPAEVVKETPMIVVRPRLARMVEPFQRIILEENVETPVRETNWVLDQLRAGLLVKC